MAAAEAGPDGSGRRFRGGAGGTERALEEAAAYGSLCLAGRRLRHFPAAAARWDLSDTTEADLSGNRFGELPAAACSLVALEGLSLARNRLRSLSPAIANLRSLAHLDLSCNSLTALPPSLCLLPLRSLLAAGNRLSQLPDNLGALGGTLRQLDVGGNQLRCLPPGIGRLRQLRDLNLRRNRLTALPEELSELPLERLDVSCNRLESVPGCFRRLRRLRSFGLEHNPLRSPPAQICLKGPVHIFKYLQLQPEAPPQPPPPGFAGVSPPRGGGLDSGFHSVDSGRQRWSGNESLEEAPEPPRPPGEQEGSPAPLLLCSHPPSCRAAAKPAPPNRDPPPAELMAEMRQTMESLLQFRLPEDLGEALKSLLHRTHPELLPQMKTPALPRDTPPALWGGFALFYGLLMALLLSAYRCLFGC